MSRLEQLQKLLSAEPDDVFLNFGLAMELAKAQQYQESLTRFERVIELDPKYIAAYFQKGRTLIQMHDSTGARRELQRGIEAATKYGDHHAAEEMLALLGEL